jgi:hypothetical protein
MKHQHSSRHLPEFNALVEIARSYIAGNVHFSHVCSAAEAFNEAAKIHMVDPRVRHIALEWFKVSSRVWPEWGKAENQLTPEEFKEWVRHQLSVFDAKER